jgi:tRNA threonylcarbamoyladenosine biosynthesis protein TsaE
MAPAELLRRLVTRAPLATEELGAALGARLPAGSVVALLGELGTGKTTFVRGLARGLEVEDEVTSPTFALMHEALGRLPFFHLDAWRSAAAARFLEGGAAEWLEGQGVAAIEWAERVEPYLAEPRLELRLTHLGPEERRIEIWLVASPRAGADGPAAELRAAVRALPLPAGARELGPESP